MDTEVIHRDAMMHKATDNCSSLETIGEDERRFDDNILVLVLLSAIHSGSKDDIFALQDALDHSRPRAHAGYNCEIMAPTYSPGS